MPACRHCAWQLVVVRTWLILRTHYSHTGDCRWPRRAVLAHSKVSFEWIMPSCRIQRDRKRLRPGSVAHTSTQAANEQTAEVISRTPQARSDERTTRILSASQALKPINLPIGRARGCPLPEKTLGSSKYLELSCQRGRTVKAKVGPAGNHIMFIAHGARDSAQPRNWGMSRACA